MFLSFNKSLISAGAVMLCGSESNHRPGCLPVHRYQLWAQRSVTSMGNLYLDFCCFEASFDVQKQAEQLLEQNQRLMDYIGELVNCLSQAKSLSLNHLASPATAKVRHTSGLPCSSLLPCGTCRNTGWMSFVCLIWIFKIRRRTVNVGIIFCDTVVVCSN